MFNEAVGLDPEYARAHTALGRCYVHQTQGWAEPESFYLAERSLRAALELDPSLIEARLFLVHVDLHHGDKERARGLITLRVRAAAHADPDVAFWLACFYAMEGLTDEAVDWLRRAVRLGNENYPLFAASAKLGSLKGEPRFEELLEDLGKAWEARR
jgi:serine/threonine-protein kinase